jgi:ribosome silencing factor RsfS/YbeB/iojap
VPKTKKKTAIPPQAKPKTSVKPTAAKAKGSTAKPVSKKTAAHPSAHSKPAHATRAPKKQSLQAVVVEALDDMKALEIKVLDVRGLTDIADTMIIASGTSDRHVRSVAQRVVEKTKAAGYRPHGIEGQQDSDWVLIDLHDMIVHVMLPRVREFYGLEKLWDMTATKRAAARA